MQDASKPIWINKQPQTADKKDIRIFLATPVHSECSIHYTQSLLTFQQECLRNNILVSFSLLKSSLVTQGRNLSVANFLEESEKLKYTHFLFIDSDIEFKFETIMKMIEADKDVIAAPYTLKSLDWEKIAKRSKDQDLTGTELSRLGYLWPIKIEGHNEIKVTNGVMEVTHAPTGCMLIKRQVFHKMIDAYPELQINQPTIINGQEKSRPYFYNFFDTYHEPETKRYYGEDFGFCKRWTAIGGKCYLYIMDELTHIGEYRYTGRLIDDLQKNFKRIDESAKIK